jgi:4-hydroxy-2-oxoheptanedioate aldolase
MKMRRSRVVDKMKQGKPVICFKTNLSDARATELAALFKFDCIWTDMEHTANDWSVIEKQIWAAKSQDVDVMVRVARGSYSDYIRPFELDASGIMIPHVMNKKDAESIVKMIRYMPLGRRPIDAGNADSCYFNTDFAEYIKFSNENRFVIVQIEDPEALEAADEIASVQGVDMIFFGPGDLSHAIGIPGQWDHPLLKEARIRVAGAAAKHKKYAGTVGTAENLADLLKLGYGFINIGADIIGISKYCRDISDKLAGICPLEEDR